MVCLTYGWVLSIRLVGLHPTFSRHGIAQILSALGELIWLNEKVEIHLTISWASGNVFICHLGVSGKTFVTIRRKEAG